MNNITSITNLAMTLAGTGLVGYLISTLFKRIDKIDDIDRRVFELELRERIKKESNV
jgi:hypothetical protein